MQDWLAGLVGEGAAPVLSVVIAALFVIGLAIVVIRLMRRLTRGGMGFGATQGPRVEVLDVTSVDPRRKLVLVRRDDVEHLILIGGANDLVVEARIGQQNIAVEPGARRAPVVEAPVPAVQAPPAVQAVAPARRPAPPPPRREPVSDERSPPVVPVPVSGSVPGSAPSPQMGGPRVPSPEQARKRVEPVFAPEAQAERDMAPEIRAAPEQPRAAEPARVPSAPRVEPNEPKAPAPRTAEIERVPNPAPASTQAPVPTVAVRPDDRPMAGRPASPRPVEAPTRSEPVSSAPRPAPAIRTEPPFARATPQPVRAPDRAADDRGVAVAPSVEIGSMREDRAPLVVRSFASTIGDRQGSQPAPQAAVRPAPPAPMPVPAVEAARSAPAARESEIDDAFFDDLTRELEASEAPVEQAAAPARQLETAPPIVATAQPKDNGDLSLEDEMERLLRDFSTQTTDRR